MKSKKYIIEVKDNIAITDFPEHLYKIFLQGYYAGKEQAREETAKKIRSKVLEMLDNEKNMLIRFCYSGIVVWIENVYGIEVEE